MSDSFKKYIITNYLKHNYKKYILNKTTPLGEMFIDVAKKIDCDVSEPQKINYSYNTTFKKVKTNNGEKKLCFVDYILNTNDIIYMTKKGNLLSYNMNDKRLKSFKDDDLKDIKKLNFIKSYRINKKFKKCEYDISYILIDNEDELYIKDNKFYDRNKNIINSDNKLYNKCISIITELNK